MALTGHRAGLSLTPGWQVASAMRGAALALCSLGGPEVDGPALLGERAAHTGFTRNGAISPGGSCRILSTADSWIALNLARAADIEIANAWLDDADLDASDPWRRVAAAVASVRTSGLLKRSAGLGLAMGALDEVEHAVPFVVSGPGASRVRDAPLVVDLSSLWAGPLCANLLADAGARVVKVESVERPDAMRGSSPSFFELLHRGHHQVSLPFSDAGGIDALRRILDRADVVIESSRPRALSQLGIDAMDFVARGATWISITAYGRSQPERVGFGDDVGVAAGLVAGTPDEPLFCSDAIADPIAGLHAAVAALAVLANGGGRLVDVSMAAVARVARGDRVIDDTEVRVASPRSRSWP